MYSIEIRHDSLGKYRHIQGKDKYVVEQKAYALQQQWNDMWKRRQEIEHKKEQRESWRNDIQHQKNIAQERSLEADNSQKALNDILTHTLNVDDRIIWDDLKDKRIFSEKKPAKREDQLIPPPPDEQYFAIKFSLIDLIIPPLKRKKQQLSKDRYHAGIAQWEALKNRLIQANTQSHETYAKLFAEWNVRASEFQLEQEKSHKAIDLLQAEYNQKDTEAILEYCDLVLSRSDYPDYFPQQFELEYRKDSETLILDYILPNIGTIPTLKEVSYVQSKTAFKESHLSEAQIAKIYDKLLYDICLRTVHELFEADVINALKAISFNGIVNFISPATGQEVNSCILSLYTEKNEFEKINLAHIESKACFKSLKGVGSSKLHSMTPVAPILQMNKQDRRFIEAYDVSYTLNETTNIAMMDWKDFEQLVREIFEKEFAIGGGEVKVTQSSRDGGVDAVIFDPDPIRGGKIVVQAKRYNNTVNVSAVRDLYGTVMNEGANKGILITTSDYGPDSYTFAKDKPLTLMNGGHLLHLLGKHGRAARIELGQSKQVDD